MKRFVSWVTVAVVSMTMLQAAGAVEPVKGSAEPTRCNAFNDATTTWAAVAAGSEQPLPLRSLVPPVLLPDGSEFKTWEPAEAVAPLRTFVVARRHPQAADSNPGTEERPWKTIGHAAEVLQPGNRVIVKEGLYREWVRPARGGTGPTKMITYQAAPGETVILSGSEPLVGKWSPSTLAGQTSAAQAWMIDLPETLVGGYNPFAESNITSNMTSGLPGMAKRLGWLKPPYTLPRGLIFQKDRRLKQVVEYADLAKGDGLYWVEPGGRRLHVVAFAKQNPAETTWEVTARPFAFAPEQAGLGFVRVAGFSVERVANCFPVPQLGAISTKQGHHWIVENNVVRQVNGLGLDYGRRQTFLPWLVPADTPKLGGVGTVVRRNAFYECGVCSLSGLGLIGGLVEGNYSTGCGWHRVMALCEAGGIKLHYLKHVLVRGNVIDGTVNAHGLWTDHSIHNTRITGNIVVGAPCAYYLEASYGPNLIDHNIFWGSGSGILLEHTGNATLVNNLIGGCKGAAVRIGVARPEPKGRMVDMETKRYSSSDHNRLQGNVFYGVGDRALQIPEGMDNLCDYNVFAHPADGKPFDLAAWRQKTGFDAHSTEAVANLAFAPSDWTLRGVIPTLKAPRIDSAASDYFGAARDTLSEAGPLVRPDTKPEAVLWKGPGQGSR